MIITFKPIYYSHRVLFLVICSVAKIQLFPDFTKCGTGKYRKTYENKILLYKYYM